MRRVSCMLLLVLVLPVSCAAESGEWSGYVAAEWRGFYQDARSAGQPNTDLSLAFEPEYYRAWDGGRQSLTFKPFLRLDREDARRSHADIRELQWIKAAEGWELRAGIGKVFWGVTEALHLVDIINQTDLVENPDGEQKLGQPMLKLSLEREWGMLDLYALPGFRERTFPGRHARLRSHPYVDSDHPRYESAAEDRHADLALRYWRSSGDWDIGLAHFWGTGREPRLVLAGDAFIPHYDIIHQTSLDLQAVKGDWLWKLEALRRSGQGQSWHAATGGFEYTLVGVMDSAADLGLLLEYMVDDRHEKSPSPFQDDVFLALRWTANDVQSSQLLAGVIVDRDSGARLYNIEASRRLGEAWKLTAQARAWSNIPAADPLAGLQRDDYLELTLARYF